MAYSTNPNKHDNRLLDLIDEATRCPDDNGFCFNPVATKEVANDIRYKIYSGIHFLNHKVKVEAALAEEGKRPAEFTGNPLINALMVKVERIPEGWQIRLIMKWRPGATDDYLANTMRAHGYPESQCIARLPSEDVRANVMNPATMEELADRRLAEAGMGIDNTNVKAKIPSYSGNNIPEYDPEDRTIRNAFAHIPSSDKSENGAND